MFSYTQSLLIRHELLPSSDMTRDTLNNLIGQQKATKQFDWLTKGAGQH